MTSARRAVLTTGTATRTAACLAPPAWLVLVWTKA
jgi:hypothetical protein